MLEKLTPEQEQLMEEVKNEWLDRLFSCKNRTEKVSAEKHIKWIYSISNLAEPEVVFCLSPMGCIEKLREISGEPERVEPFSLYGGIWDYDWVAFYDFFDRIGILDDDNFRTYRDMLKANIFAMIQMDTHCFASEMPSMLKRDHEHRLHCEDGPAIFWDGDGYGQYYWRGNNVPEHWIMRPETITKEEIIGEDNLELRRVIMEIIGAEAFYGKVFGEMVVVDEDDDAYGKPMRLLRSAEKDPVINDYVYVLSVIDTSTDRKYDIFPDVKTFPDAKNNVWSAKASTFRMTKEQFDVIAES